MNMCPLNHSRSNFDGIHAWAQKRGARVRRRREPRQDVTRPETAEGTHHRLPTQGLSKLAFDQVANGAPPIDESKNACFLCAREPGRRVALRTEALAYPVKTRTHRAPRPHLDSPWPNGQKKVDVAWRRRGQRRIAKLGECAGEWASPIRGGRLAENGPHRKTCRGNREVDARVLAAGMEQSTGDADASHTIEKVFPQVRPAVDDRLNSLLLVFIQMLPCRVVEHGRVAQLFGEL